jgi:hypothetical protein
MRRTKLVLCVAILLAAVSPGWLAAQSPLDYFSDDCFLVVRIDLATLFKVLPQAEVDGFRSMSNQSFGFDITERADALSVGFDLESLMQEKMDQRCIVIEGRVSIEEILEAARRGNESLNEIKVGGLTAYEANYEQGMQFYFSNFAPNLWIHGSKAALELFSQVRAGGRGSTADNALLRSAWAETGQSSFMRLACYFDGGMKEMMAAQLPALGDLDTLAMTANLIEDGFDFTVVLASTQVQSLNALLVLAQQVMPSVAEGDTTGLAQEIVETLEYSLEGERLIINGRISLSAVESLIRQFSY